MAENIRKNKLPPTLIIGLGGTGCDIVSRVDKLSNSEQREYIRFVYVKKKHHTFFQEE